MTSTVEYQGNLRTSCVHLQSQSLIYTDAPVDNHGKGEQFSPTDLLATSLAACMLTVMGIKAQQMNLSLEGMKIDVNKIMSATPRRVGAIELTVFVPAHLKELDEHNKQVLKKTGENCPVFKSLHPEINIAINWNEWVTKVAANDV